MSLLIDSTLWVDYFRPKTPAKIKLQVVPFINAAHAALCEPIRFEILRAALRHERAAIEAVFVTLPLLKSHSDLWDNAAALGRKCTDAGISAPAMDILIAQVALENHSELVTFDSHFAAIAGLVPLKVQLLRRLA